MSTLFNIVIILVQTSAGSWNQQVYMLGQWDTLTQKYLEMRVMSLKEIKIKTTLSKLGISAVSRHIWLPKVSGLTITEKEGGKCSCTSQYH